MKKSNPLAVVSSVPNYVTDGDKIKSGGWLLRVDFPGINVPKVRGGTVVASSVNIAPAEYSDKYPFITRVEYLFKDSLFRTSYRKMCKFENKMLARINELYIQDIKTNKIIPVDTDHYGYRGYGGWTCRDWRICVDFKGDITKVFKQKIAKKCGLIPAGARLGEYEYHPDKNITKVRYDFDGGILFVDGKRRAYRFERKVQSQMKRIQKRKQIKKGAVSPIMVSDVPHLKDGGYEVSVKYDGNWENYLPKLTHRFEYDPFGARIVKCDYNATDNLTTVNYLFRCGISNRGETRAWDFIDKIREQINAMKQDENIK